MTTTTPHTTTEWTAHQRCPRCMNEPGSCDWCHHCDIELVCAQDSEGLALATGADDPDGTPVLILAVSE